MAKWSIITLIVTLTLAPMGGTSPAIESPKVAASFQEPPKPQPEPTIKPKQAAPKKAAPKKKAKVAEPSITAPKTVKSGDVVVLALNEIKDARVVWIADGVDFTITDKPREIIEHSGGEIVFREIGASSVVFIAADPGTFAFTCLVIPHDIKQAIKQTRHVVTVAPTKDCDEEKDSDDGNHDEGDEGQQEETEPANNWDKADYFVVIEESGDRSAEQAKLFASEFWKIGIANSGLNRPLVYDKDSQQGKDFLAEAGSRSSYDQVPFFAVMSKDGKFKRSFPATWKESEIKAILGIKQ